MERVPYSPTARLLSPRLISRLISRLIPPNRRPLQVVELLKSYGSAAVSEEEMQNMREHTLRVEIKPFMRMPH